jgi:hypothetical protein
VERQLLPALWVSPRAGLTDLELQNVLVSSNRIRLQLASASYAGSGPLEITIEQLGGYLVASLSRRGFVDALGDNERLLLENVLCVFYHRAHVDLVREQIQAELGPLSHYEVLDEGLVVRSGAVRGDLVYPLQTRLKKAIKPRVIGDELESLPSLRSERLLYKQQPVAFLDWEAAWGAAVREREPLPRLTLGSSLLGRTTLA